MGIFDNTSAMDEGDVDQFISWVRDIDKLMWEATMKNHQQYLILHFDNNVYLESVPTTDVMALKALRQVLHDDTLKRALARGK